MCGGGWQQGGFSAWAWGTQCRCLEAAVLVDADVRGGPVQALEECLCRIWLRLTDKATDVGWVLAKWVAAFLASR